MMHQETYIFTDSELEQYMTKGAHAMLEHLAAIGEIDKVRTEELQRTKIIIIRKKSQICQLWKKVFGKTDNEVKHVLVATIPDLGRENA